jgi:hypothetical protein
VLLAVAPLHWKLSQEARPYTIYIFFMLLTLLLLLRTLEKPTRGRVLAYSLSAMLTTLTRGLDPQVLLLCGGLVLSVAWLTSSGIQRQAVSRAWWATVAAGLFAACVVQFLLRDDAGWTVFATEVESRSGGVDRVIAAVWQNAQIWWNSPNALFGRGALPLMVLGTLGAAWGALRWRTWPGATRCVIAVMWLCGPAYLLVYSTAVANHPICNRYALFLAPVVLVFAGAMIAELLRDSFSPEGDVRTRMASVFIAVAVVVLPAQSTLALSRQYFRPDWRGSAEYLAGRYGAGDVVLVLADRPLGAGQSPYWGKLDWPTDDVPLGESMWALATWEPHWQRLLRQDGRCCVVLKRFVGAQDADEYTRIGVQVPPHGARLAKFRGLDVFEGFSGEDLPERLAAACAAVAEVPLENGEARAIAHLLRSRIELARGNSERARAAYVEAQACVPLERQALFATVTAAHCAALTGVPFPSGAGD